MASQTFNTFPRPISSKEQDKIINAHIKLCENSKCLIHAETLTITAFWPSLSKLNTRLPNNTVHTTIIANYNEIIHTEFYNFDKIYTDASKIVNRVGFAFCMRQTLKFFKLPLVARIFTVESQAIKEALIFAKTTTGSKILIINYSLGALLGIESPYFTKEIIQKNL